MDMCDVTRSCEQSDEFLSVAQCIHIVRCDSFINILQHTALHRNTHIYTHAHTRSHTRTHAQPTRKTRTHLLALRGEEPGGVDVALRAGERELPYVT